MVSILFDDVATIVVFLKEKEKLNSSMTIFRLLS
jgi:hypothetical protein